MKENGGTKVQEGLKEDRDAAIRYPSFLSWLGEHVVLYIGWRSWPPDQGLVEAF